MNCEVGKNQRGIKRVPRRKEKVCSYKKSEKGFHLIPEKTAVSKVVFWKLQEGKNREREREREAQIHVANVGNRQSARLTADNMHQSGESGHQKAEWKIQPRTERQEKNFEIKIKSKETGERTFFLLASATQTLLPPPSLLPLLVFQADFLSQLCSQ